MLVHMVLCKPSHASHVFKEIMVPNIAYRCYQWRISTSRKFIFTSCPKSFCDVPTHLRRLSRLFDLLNRRFVATSWLESRSVMLILRHPYPITIMLDMSHKLDVINYNDSHLSRQVCPLCRNLECVSRALIASIGSCLDLVRLSGARVQSTC